MEEVEAVKRFYEATGGSCLYCEIIATELEEEKRVVSENEKFVAISPYAARFPFETWILPRAHEMAFEDLTDDERTPFARILKDALGRMYNILDDPPMNYYIHTAPCDRKEARYHWHLGKRAARRRWISPPCGQVGVASTGSEGAPRPRARGAP